MNSETLVKEMIKRTTIYEIKRICKSYYKSCRELSESARLLQNYVDEKTSDGLGKVWADCDDIKWIFDMGRIYTDDIDKLQYKTFIMYIHGYNRHEFQIKYIEVDNKKLLYNEFFRKYVETGEYLKTNYKIYYTDGVVYDSKENILYTVKSTNKEYGNITPITRYMIPKIYKRILSDIIPELEKYFSKHIIDRLKFNLEIAIIQSNNALITTKQCVSHIPEILDKFKLSELDISVINIDCNVYINIDEIPCDLIDNGHNINIKFYDGSELIIKGSDNYSFIGNKNRFSVKPIIDKIIDEELNKFVEDFKINLSKHIKQGNNNRSPLFYMGTLIFLLT